MHICYLKTLDPRVLYFSYLKFDTKPLLHSLLQALQRLEPGSTREEFNDLCFCLTLPDLKGHAEYSTWTPQLGRLWCFEALRGYLGLLFPGQETPMEVGNWENLHEAWYLLLYWF